MTRGFTDGEREQITRRSALRRMVEINDVANTLAFLVSEQARNITGTVVTVDAGSTA
jgi:3-oxoacyl-[acyl-carrier protein] reductase